MKKADKFVFFWGADDFMSNFYPKKFYYEGKVMLCSEVAFMLEKALFFNDFEVAKALVSVKSAKQAKMLGRKVKNYDDSKWEKIRYEKMKKVLSVKFKDNFLRKSLLSTGDRLLVEASPMDKIWGIGMNENNIHAENPERWLGQNLLGKALMEVRQEIKEELGM